MDQHIPQQAAMGVDRQTGAVSRSQLEQLREYDTALLANLLGYVDSTPTHLWYMGNDIRALTPKVEPTVGVAVTCEIDTSTPNDQTTGDMEGYWDQLQQMEAAQVPSVWVVQCVGSRPRHECVLGDGMAKTLFSAGCVGVVANGGVRDINGLLTIPFAAYGSGVTIHHCNLRMRSGGEPVEIGGVTVHHGEVIHANAEGVIKIPTTAIDRVLQQAPAYRAFEHEVHQMLRRTDIKLLEKRKRVKEMLDKYGFQTCDSRAGRN